MYATPTMYVKNATYVDLPDIEFFQHCLTVAQARFESGQTDENDVSVDVIKKSTPVAYMSTVTKMTEDDKTSLSRREINERGRRRFIMIDADYDAGDEDESSQVRNKIIELAREHSTPVLIYPTASYPEKPRFRAVMFTKRVMPDTQYYKAMSWWFDQLGIEPIDEADMRITANRNLPVFTNPEQIEQIYSTLTDDELQPLDNSLWKDYTAPKKKKPADYSALMASDSRVNDKSIMWDDTDIVRAAREIGLTGLGATRHSIWKFVQSIACAKVESTLTPEVAGKIMYALAERGETKAEQERWYKGNIEMMQECERAIVEQTVALQEIRPLIAYSELIAIAQIDIS